MRRALFGVTVGAIVATLGLVAMALPANAAVVRVRKPTAPTNLVVTPVNTAIVASWSAPLSDGGSPVTGYIAKVGRTPCVLTGPTSCIATGLRNGRRYSVVVRAINARGNGRAASAKHVSPNTTQNCAYVGPHANLQGCTNLLGADLSNTDLTGANLSGASLQYVNLTGANLTGANLTNAYLTGANLTGVTLTNATLTGADLTASTSSGIIGTPTALPTGWSLVNGELIGPGAILTGQDFSGLDLTGVDLAGANVQSVNFTGTDLSGADLIGASAQYATFTNADLTGANLTGAYFTGADLTGVTWSNTTCPDGSNSDSNGNTCIGFGI